MKRDAEAEAAFQQALAAHQAGRSPEAARLYRRVLALAPRHFNARHLLGVLTLQLGRAKEAAALIRGAIALRPDVAAAHNNLGSALRQAGETATALAAYDAALALEPGYAEALLNRARLLRAMGRAETLAAYDAVLTVSPDDPRARGERGRLLAASGQPRLALADFDRALALAPDGATWLDRARACAALRAWEPAADSCHRALALDPQLTEAADLLWHAEMLANRLEAAERACEQGIARDPAAPAPRLALVTVLLWQANAEAARERAREAAQALGRQCGASAAMTEACTRLLLTDLVPPAYSSEAELEEARARLEVDAMALEAAVAALPPPSAADLAAAWQAAYQVSWFYHAYQQREDAALLRQLNLALARMLAVPDAPPPPRAPGRLRIGIASELLFHHNATRWAADWFTPLRDRWDITCYALHGVEDGTVARFAALGRLHREPASPAGLAALLAAIRADAPDLLMLPDVGMSPSSRLLALHRLAPVQFSGWGHPLTTGAPAMTHYLSAALMEPVGAEAHYTETLVRLPNLGLYLRPETPAPGPTPALPEGRILFGCLQSLYKYLPRHDFLLARIARELPGALFLFLEGHPAGMTRVTRARLEAAFHAEGLDPARHLLFLPRVSPAGYLGLLRRLDVALDSIGWSGGNSSVELVEAGVPLVTLPGPLMRGRHSLAILQRCGVSDGIARDADDYVAQAVALGRDADRRRAVAEAMRQGRAALYEDGEMLRGLTDWIETQAAALGAG